MSNKVIKVCVGSSCHLKGSYGVIDAFKETLKKYGVEDLVDLQASFCLGHCAQGVSVRTEGLSGEECPEVSVDADGFIMHNVNADNVEDMFVRFVYPKLNA